MPRTPKARTPRRMAECHPDLPHYAHGCCSPCYKRRDPTTGVISPAARSGTRPRTMSTCHPGIPNYAKGLCQTCYMKQWQRDHPERMAAKRANLPPATCHPHKKVRARGLCDACYRRQWRAENAEHERFGQQVEQRAAYHRRPLGKTFEVTIPRYGLTLGDYAQLLIDQSGLCTCYSAQLLKPQIDHCHTTGRVRSLLCPNCNSTLGYAKEDISRLQALIKYITGYC